MKLFSRTFSLNFSHRILIKMKVEYVSLVSFLLLSMSVFADDALKNHRAEKRQDNSYLFFGGWRPVKSGNHYYHASASGRYHDLISALPGSLDASASLYTHALPTNYYKDIYSYYPRPAIKSTPKKNTPTYMERFKPKRQQPKHGGRNTMSGGSPQYIDIQQLEIKHLRDLQNVLLQAKELPLTQLNLPNNGGGKPYEIVELAVQPFQQNSHSTRSRNTNRYNRNRGAQGNNKGSYRRVPQNVTPNQLPLQYQYISLPKIKSLVPQILPKQLSVKLPQSVPAVEDLLSLKNIQVVEVPVPAAVPISISSGKHNGGSQYGKRNNGYSQQYRISTPKSPQKSSFPANTYYAHQAEQPRKHYPAPTPSKSNYGLQQQQQQQPQIEAELIKLSEDEVQELLKNLQIVSKNSQDFLKILPFADAAHKSKQEQVHLVVAVPEENHGQNVETSAYESQNHGEGTNYGAKEQQYVAVPQEASYQSPADASISYNSGGYQVNGQSQAVEHNAAGYEMDEHAGNAYEQYVDGKAGYGQKSYDVRPSNEYTSNEGQGYAQAGYDQPGYDQPAQQQGGGQNHQEQYLQVISPPVDGSGYRREPVLAVEIQKGQSIEEAIKAIDPETLQRLGAHGKDGLEIEVVEVPVDEYSSESKKAETYVSSSNSTTSSPAKRTTTASPSVKEKSTATEKKS